MMVCDTFLTMENQYMNPNDISENYMRNISRKLKDPSFEILFGANMAMRNPLIWMFSWKASSSASSLCAAGSFIDTGNIVISQL